MEGIQLRLGKGAIKPSKGSSGAAGWDIACKSDFSLEGQCLVRTGVYLDACPEDIYIRIAPRSKLANKFGVDVLAGVVDSDYRGEICVVLSKQDHWPLEFRRGDRIAQLIFEKLSKEEVYIDGKRAGRDSKVRGTGGVQDEDLRL